ncbi:MAG: hypothetical protein ACKO1F_13880, partial [Flammeovirgaceae bacterium]
MHKEIRTGMRISILILGILFQSRAIMAQNSIEWDGVYQLRVTDFKSPSSKAGESNIYSLHTTANMDFSFQMTNAEFMFTKNF